MKKTLAIILLPMLFCSQLALAQEDTSKLQWQLGAALAAFQIPLYPGSSEYRRYLLPLPYLKVRSKYLDVDQSIRAKLFHSKRIRLSVSADLGVPVRSHDSRVRKGMPNLDATFQIGPLLEVNLAGARDQARELRFELPVRNAFATDTRAIHNLGLIYEPRITYQTHRLSKNGFAWEVTVGVRYASEVYNAYYYDVPAAYATASRPQFISGAGYAGRFADIITGWREDELIYWTYLRYQNLSGAVFENSPLVEQKSYYFFGGGITWIFAHSL